MGGNGIGSGVSRRLFLLSSGAAAVDLACGAFPSGRAEDPIVSDPVSPSMNPARFGTVQLPPQEGKLEFRRSSLIDMPQTPAPAGIFVGNDEASVVSSRDLGGLSAMNGLFRFELPGANSSLASSLGSQDQLYLSDVAVLPDNSFVITTANGFFHNNVFCNFPSELRNSGTTLFPGAAIFTGGQNAGALWITLSAFSGDRFMSHEDPYLGGMLLAFPVIAGSIDAEAAEIIPMSGQNSTSIGHNHSDQLLILNSGNYLSSSSPSIDLVSVPEARHMGSIDLPAGITAQTSPHLAISEDGEHAFLGTVDESRRVLKVNLLNGNISQAMIEASGFHSSVVVSGGFLYVTSHETERSSVTVLDPATLAVVETIGLDWGKAGMSAAYAGGIIQMLPHRAIFIEPVEV